MDKAINQEKLVEEKIIKGDLNVAYDQGKSWKFQIRWLKLEWVVPKKLNAKNTVCVSSYKFLFKCGLQNHNWVVKLSMISINAQEFKK